MNQIVIAEAIAGIFLCVSLFDQFSERDRSTSSQWLKALSVLNLLWLVSDSLSYVVSLKWCPYEVEYLLNLLAYTTGSMVLTTLMAYCDAYFRERSRISRWTFSVPAVVAIASGVVVAVRFFSGKILVYENGGSHIVGEIPLAVLAVQSCILFYMPLMAFLKRKDLGTKSVVLFCLYGFLPVFTVVVSVFTGYDYSVVAGALSVSIIVTRLQRDLVEVRLKTMNLELRSLRR